MYKFQYQETHRFFAQIADGMEELGAAELSELGARNPETAYRGIYFEADRATLYRINYTARLITRVLAPLISFPCHDTDYLYRKAKKIRWRDFFALHHTFAIFANVSNSRITHSQYAALCLKDAIADYFRDHYKKRPDVNPIEPDVWFNLHIEENHATISLDTSGGSLHRRGYRKDTVRAPMQETVAAAIIRLSQWDGSKPLYDPMCGSGTLLGEAMMHYCRIPSGILREQFGFEFLPDYDQELWESVKAAADQQMHKLPENLITGSDIAKRAITSAHKNFRCLPQGRRIALKIRDFRKIPELENMVIVCNPPYGIRMEGKQAPDELYKSLGDFLKQRCKGSTAYIYFGNRDMLKRIGLKPSWKKPLKNGGLDGRLAKYEMY